MLLPPLTKLNLMEIVSDTQPLNRFRSKQGNLFRFASDEQVLLFFPGGFTREITPTPSPQTGSSLGDTGTGTTRSFQTFTEGAARSGTGTTSICYKTIRDGPYLYCTS